MRSDTLFAHKLQLAEKHREDAGRYRAVWLCRADRVEDGQEREIKPQFGPLYEHICLFSGYNSTPYRVRSVLVVYSVLFDLRVPHTLKPPLQAEMGRDRKSKQQQC